jgi:hypothetical protein
MIDGFYWIKYGGRPVVAEHWTYRARGPIFERGVWNLPGDEESISDADPEVEIISGPLEAPKTGAQ